ncbi:hypothetical protein J1N35_014337 [Gossypium stocksii]|uniref:Uncharacterized protein n=1 Tax=Gossypium stocksii TaxID=47602 RepID=A0A9D4A9M4_9ROSI|nr:hypothetical protein J1N35_014337 [Gossypium stocksii]
MKSFMRAFKAREVKSTKGNEKVEAADDEASKDHEVMPRDETMEDAIKFACPVSEGVGPGEQSMPLRRMKVKKIAPKGSNVPIVDKNDLGDDMSNA